MYGRTSYNTFWYTYPHMCTCVPPFWCDNCLKYEQKNNGLETTLKQIEREREEHIRLIDVCNDYIKKIQEMQQKRKPKKERKLQTHIAITEMHKEINNQKEIIGILKTALIPYLCDDDVQSVLKEVEKIENDL